MALSLACVCSHKTLHKTLVSQPQVTVKLHPVNTTLTHPLVLKDTAALLDRTRQAWGGQQDLWVFGYASLIWRPEFEHAEQRWAQVHGYHRALKMWSRINRGTPECPGLVFALISGGSCKGAVYRIPQAQGHQALDQLWQREMPSGVYDPKWLPCRTPQGPVKALAFTLSRQSPNFTGALCQAQLQYIFKNSQGRYGSTLDYARQTYDCLAQAGIHDRELQQVLSLA
jgi:cation transport protein ChaC